MGHLCSVLMTVLSIIGSLPKAIAADEVLIKVEVPAECRDYINGVKSGKIDVDHEMRRTHTAAYSAGGVALLGYSGMAATSVTILGGSIMATGWIPVVGWAAAAAAGSYLLYKAYKDHQKVNCLEFAKQINISIKENHDPRVNSTTQQKMGRAVPADSAVKSKMLTAPAAH